MCLRNIAALCRSRVSGVSKSLGVAFPNMLQIPQVAGRFVDEPYLTE